MQYKLFLHTLGQAINLILLKDNNQVIDTKIKVTNQDMIEHIIETISKLLKAHAIEPKQIKIIYWISHPGLFTGMRVGALICKAWSFIYPTKIYETNYLRFQATKNCLSIIEAPGKNYYLQVYKNSRPHSKILFLTAAELEEYKKKYPHYEVIKDTKINLEMFLKQIKVFKRVKMQSFVLPYFKSPC